jgi:hypothetical protein
MPYNRPGPGVYVTRTGAAVQHGAPAVESNFAGVAVKQKTRGWSDPVSNQATIDVGEAYFLVTKGVVQVPNTGISASVKGDPIWITTAGVLTTATGTPKFGRIVEVAGNRGVPLGKVRIDLDSKDSFV